MNVPLGLTYVTSVKKKLRRPEIVIIVNYVPSFLIPLIPHSFPSFVS
jgi:hypothetical protein